MRCLYEVLEVDPNSDDSTIKTAYRRAALQWHPGQDADGVAAYTIETLARLMSAARLTSNICKCRQKSGSSARS